MSKRILESIPVHSHDFTQFLIFHVSSFVAQFTAVRRNMIGQNGKKTAIFVMPVIFCKNQKIEDSFSQEN